MHTEDPLAGARILLQEMQSKRTTTPVDADPRGDQMQTDATGETAREILGRWNADEALQAAALLHSHACDGAIDIARIEEVCGSDVARLCHNYQCLTAIDSELVEKTDSTPRVPTSFGPQNRATESREYRRSFLKNRVSKPEGWYGNPLALDRIRAYCAAYSDPRLGFLHAAVLWQRFLAIRESDAAAQIYTDEATQLLGPFLEMLGMRQLRAELLEWFAGRRRTRQKLETAPRSLLDAIKLHVQTWLPNADINTENTQIHNFDAYHTAIRTHAAPQIPTVEITVETDLLCYEALYWLHQLFIPVEGAMVDNIAASRMNGYRGLSTGVMAPAAIENVIPGAPLAAIHEAELENAQRVRVNFRIATHEMNEVNRWGLAGILMRGRLPDERAGGWWQQAKEGLKAIESAQLGELPDTLYVFSPHGQLFRFRRGCTVVDFAYHVHSELADRCSRFYVNGVPVEPAFVLHHLDLVELEHDPLAPGPTQVWLDAARTSRARGSIERFLKRQGQGVYQGQKIVEDRRKVLEKHYGFSIPDHRINQAVALTMRRLKLTRVDELFTEIAAGRWSADRMLHTLFEAEVTQQVKLPRGLGIRPQQLQLAQCCRPKPGDDIVGRVQQRRGVATGLKVHRRDCAKIAQHLESGDEYLELRWRLQPKLKTTALLEMSALNDDGLLGEAIHQIYTWVPRTTLHKVEAVARHGIAQLRFTIEAESNEILDEIEKSLRTLPNRQVDRVQRLSLPPSEQAEMAAMHAAGSSNPYSRLPVHDREMFFGRSDDLSRVMDWLRAGAGSVWLRGQKRVGKTSLLLHLRRYHLEEHGFVPVYVDFQLLGSMEDADIFYEVAGAIYSELQADTNRTSNRLDEVGAPLRDLFYHDPQAQFVAYLRSVQRRLGARRLVLLIDEFSRTIDAYRRGTLDESFFYQWRGFMLATMPAISFVTVVQQKTYDLLAVQRAQEDVDPIWELLELGEQRVLRPLDENDVRRLIEWPIRNFLEYSPETIDSVARLTGGSPFLIQAFCFKLVTHMTRFDRHQVSSEDVETVRMEFMLPHESLFSHMLDLIHGVGHTVTQVLARIAEEEPDRPITWAQLREEMPEIGDERLERTLQKLAAQDILIQVDDRAWRFGSLLFQQWLALNSTG